MRKDIHPEYRPVLFKDISTGFEFVASSTFKTKESGEAKDGKTYPLCKMEISSSSHPFYTRTDKIVDSEGRVDKFNKKFKFKA